MNAVDFFKNDRYASMTGIELLEIAKGYAKARLVVQEMHLNAGNTTQGGAIFTLADFALAAASNAHGQLALNISSSIRFFRGSQPDDILTAEAKEQFLHQRLGNYQVEVTNQKGELIATLEGTVYRKSQPIDLEV